MTRYGAQWLAVVALLAAGMALLLLPASPAYLPRLWGTDACYQGHSTDYWVEGLRDPDPTARLTSVRAVGAIGPGAGEAVPALAALLLEDADDCVRIEAALALVKLVPASRAAVPALAQALGDRNCLVRMDAAIALVRLKTAARPAVPALLQALTREDNQTNASAFLFTIQDMVAVALGQATAGTADAVPALRAALRDADTDGMRAAVARALGEVGAPARPAVPQLRALLQADRLEVRHAAAEALSRIEGAATDTETGRRDA